MRRVIVYEGDEIFEFRVGLDGEFLKVRVHKFEWLHRP